jgi:hypothetical protein
LPAWPISSPRSKGEHKKITKKLLVRCAKTAVLLQKETTRADALAGKVATLEATLEQLTAALFERKVIG